MSYNELTKLEALSNKIHIVHINAFTFHSRGRAVIEPRGFHKLIFA